MLFIVVAIMYEWGRVAAALNLGIAASLGLMQAAIALAALGYARARGFSMKETFALRWPGGGMMVVAFFAALTMCVVSIGVGLLATALLEMAGVDVKSQMKNMERVVTRVRGEGATAALLIIAVAPGLCEETVFRGFVFSGFAGRLGPWIAAVVVAGLFGLVHVIPPQVIVTFVLGVHFAAMRILTGSIYASILVHMVNNAVVLALTSAAGSMTPPDVPSAASLGLGAGFLFVGLSLYAPCILWLWWLRRKADADVPVLTAV